MKGRCCSKGLLVSLITSGIVIIIIAVLILVLAFTLFKPKELTTKVDSINLERMDMNVNIFALKLALNVSLNLNVSINNTNNFGFTTSETMAKINYRGNLVGEAPIPSEIISPKQTKELNLTLNIMADRVLRTSNVFGDIVSDTMPLNAFLKISGKVTILGFIKVHVSSTASCDFNLILSGRTVEGVKCSYTTKI